MSEALQPGSAIVVGGSIGGLVTGLYLLKAGWDVQVYERVPAELSGRGAGIVTHDALFAALEGVGIDTTIELGIRVPGRRTFDRNGRANGAHELDQMLTSWGRVFEVLHGAFPENRYHLGKQFSRCEDDGKKVVGHFEDGSKVTGDLLIAADGFRSQTRAQFEPDCEPEYAGYIAWRGLVQENELSDQVLHEMFPYFTFCLPPGEQILGYPVAGNGNNIEPGHRRYNFVWYRPADAANRLQWLLTDIDGNCNGVSIAPNRIRPAVITDMRTAADRLLAPQFAELITKTKEPFIQPIYDLGVSNMAYGRVAILGDAAFVARPHVGMGVTKAATDAVCLAKCLSNGVDIETSLKTFERLRLPIGQKIVQRARHLGAYMQAQQKTDEEMRLAEKHRTPAAVMTETATVDFLDTPAKWNNK